MKKEKRKKGKRRENFLKQGQVPIVKGKQTKVSIPCQAVAPTHGNLV